MKKVSGYVLGVIVALLLIVIITASFGGIDLGYTSFFGVKKANAERQVYKESKTYIEGMASDLAKYRMELQTEKDKTAKKAIVDLIVSKYADFDSSKLSDTGLQQFLKDIREGKYSNEN